MKVSAKVDYAVRALVELAVDAANGATAQARNGTRPRSAESIAVAQDIPRDFLLAVLADLRRAGMVASQRGQSGGWVLLARPESISVADVIRAVDGPLVSVHGRPPEDVAYTGSAQALQQVWVAVRSSMREVLEEVTIAHLLAKSLPDVAAARTQGAGAWQRR